MMKQIESTNFKQQVIMELLSKGKEPVLQRTNDSDCFEPDLTIKQDQKNSLTPPQNQMAVISKDIGQSLRENLQRQAILEAHFSQSLNNNAELIQSILSPLNDGIFIRQFINQEQTPFLLRFLQEIMAQWREFRIEESEHKCVLSEIFSVYDKCISYVQSSLSLQEKQEYDVIVSQTKRIIDVIGKSEDKRYSNVDKRMITASNMLRLDALQFILLANYEYQNLYGEYGINCSIYSRIIRYKFYLTQNQYKSYPKLFQTMLNFLQFRYEEYFQEAISLLCLLKIAVSKTSLALQQQNLLLNHPQLACNQAIQPPLLIKYCQKKIPSKITLRFCQFCKFPPGIAIQNDQILSLRKQQAMIQLEKIPEGASLFKIGRMLINIRVQFKVPLQHVCLLYSQMKDNPQLRFNQIEEIKKKMQPCKWIYVSAINMQKSLQKLTQSKIDENHLAKRHNPVTIALVEITFERFYVYRKALNLQLQISQRFKRQKPIYIYCCQCCYNSFNQKDFEHKKAKRQSPKYTIVIAFQGNRLLFSFTIMEDILQEQLIDALSIYFEHNPMEQGTDLIVYYKNYESKMDNEVIDRYVNNFKKKYNSFVYFTMEPQHFKPQMAIYFLIIYYLRKQGRLLNQMNFGERLYANTKIILTKIYYLQK